MKKLFLVLPIILLAVLSIYSIKAFQDKVDIQDKEVAIFNEQKLFLSQLIKTDCKKVFNLELLNQKTQVLPFNLPEAKQFVLQYFDVQRSEIRIVGEFPKYILFAMDLWVKDQNLIAHDILAQTIMLFSYKNTKGEYTDCIGSIHPE